MKRKDFIKASAGLLTAAATLSSYTYANGMAEQGLKRLPKSLQPGDTIALTAPAGSIWNKWHIEKVEKILHEKGYRTIRGETLYLQEGYLAGSDEIRAKEFMQFIADKSVNGIVTMRGGWGCQRILDLLDYSVITANPKVIMGFSDITSLINAIFTKSALVTYHGPCGYSSWGDFTLDEVTRAVVDGKPFKMSNPFDYREDLKTWVPGKAEGELIGGNLTVLVAMIGTDYEPQWQGKILFLEEIGEEPYRIDRMLWQLKQAGVFEMVNGVVLGSFKDCEPEEPEKSFTLAQVFEQHFAGIKMPVYQGAAIGHIAPKFTVPIGVRAEMDADAFTIRTLERSVRL